MKHIVNHKGFLNPFFINFIKNEQPTATITDRKIKINDNVLNLENDCPLKDGTKVKVTFGNYFYIESLDDIEKRKQEVIKNKEKFQKKQKELRNQYRKESEEFNKSLALPFKWRTAFKPVLSGLSENSFGNGHNKSTVQHIQVLEDIKFGKLSRQKGQFLCSTNSGKQWLDNPESLLTDGEGNSFMPKVSCKQCLKRAKNLKK